MWQPKSYDLARRWSSFGLRTNFIPTFLTKKNLTRVQILNDTMGRFTNVRGSGAPPALAPPKAPPYPPWSITGPQPSSKEWAQLRKTTSEDERAASSGVKMFLFGAERSSLLLAFTVSGRRRHWSIVEREKTFGTRSPLSHFYNEDRRGGGIYSSGKLEQQKSLNRGSQRGIRTVLSCAQLSVFQPTSMCYKVSLCLKLKCS